MRVCSDCGLDKPDDEMHRHSSGRFYSYCRECNRARNRARYHATKDSKREQNNARAKRYRDKNAGDEEYVQRRREHSKRQYHKDKDKRRAYRKQYREKNRQRFNVYQANRRARLKSAGGSFTYVEWSELCERYGWKCLACGVKTEVTIDHVVPIALGGTNSIHNIQPLCGPCNFSKGANEKDYRQVG